jgi:hypothetical protein
VPSFGWNRGEVSVGGIRRIPVEGLRLGNQQPNRSLAAEEAAQGRAIVLIPSHIDLTRPVEVLLHLHGHNVGYRQRRTQGLHPSLRPGTVRDIETDRIEQQLEASARPMIGVLPQGTTSSGFGLLDSNAYIAEVFRVLSGVGAFGTHPAPQIARVVLSGHSGGGGPIAGMLSQGGQTRLPSPLGEVALFDAINSDYELAAVRGWVMGQLNRDLAALTAPGITPAQQQALLRGGTRFRAYYTNAFYAARHVQLHRYIEAWFSRHASALGGSSSTLYNDLRDHYRVLAVGHGEHEVILSRNNRLLDALRVLPPVPPATASTGAAATGAAAAGRSGAPPSGSHQAGSLQPKARGARPIDEVSLSLVADTLRSPGRPLRPADEKFFRQRLHHDFTRVRVHCDEKAAASARAVSAEAYTVGHDVVFARGFYSPSSRRGIKLLAHELTHVVQQSGHPLRWQKSLQRHAVPQAVPETLHPIRADEKGKPSTSFNFGRFSIFVPEKVSMGTRKEGVDDLKVHVFFSAGSVQGDIGNDILTHGLRGESDWVTIGVPSHTTISDRQIADCLASIGIRSPIKSLRLSGHSRGAFSLMNSIVQRKITTLSLIDRIVLLDADDNPDPTDPAGVTRTPKVEVLKRAGIDPAKITAYEVNVRKRHVTGAKYIPLDSGSMAAIGYVRLINDASVTQPGIAGLVGSDPAIRAQLDSLPLPPRGSFTTGTAKAGQTNLQAFAASHAKEIRDILRRESTRSGLLRFINDNNLARFAPFQFDQGISAHHFFVAELAHELTE